MSSPGHLARPLIDYLALLVPRIALHDRKLARALRSAATRHAAPAGCSEPAENAHIHALQSDPGRGRQGIDRATQLGDNVDANDMEKLGA